MASSVSFEEALDVAENLSRDEKEQLIAILSRRLAQSGRERIAADAREASEEFVAGKCLPITPEDLLKDILS